MTRIERCVLPPGALLAAYAGGRGYADCYTARVPRSVSHAAFVEAFYTTGVFKVERLLLAWFVRKPSTDAEAGELARGMREAFAAWTVEGRAADQLLMRDLGGRTRSWLMVARDADDSATRLYFGSAVVAAQRRSDGAPGMGALFTALLGFHRLYSRILLGAASSRLERAHRPARAGSLP